MIRGRNMTSSGMRLAFVVGVLLALALPKRVECGYPDAGSCQIEGKWRTMCTAYEVEPLGVFLLELAVKRDLGLAYASGEDCR